LTVCDINIQSKRRNHLLFDVAGELSGKRWLSGMPKIQTSQKLSFRAVENSVEALKAL
jgi:hypothetical protein